MTPLLILSLLGCADVYPLEDGLAVGPAITIKDSFTSAYLLPTDDGAILIDAGWRARKMEKSLESLGYDVGQITDVLLTHGHTDHLGGLERLTGATVHALGSEAALIEESGYAIDAPLTDGEILSLGGYTIEVFAMPGHTDGNAVFLIDGVLMLGDSALFQGDGSLAPAPEKHSTDPAELEGSLQALAETLAPRASEVQWMAPSHSGPSAGLDALLEWAGL